MSAREPQERIRAVEMFRGPDHIAIRVGGEESVGTRPVYSPGVSTVASRRATRVASHAPTVGRNAAAAMPAHTTAIQPGMSAAGTKVCMCHAAHPVSPTTRVPIAIAPAHDRVTQRHPPDTHSRKPQNAHAHSPAATPA